MGMVPGKCRELYEFVLRKRETRPALAAVTKTFLRMTGHLEFQPMPSQSFMRAGSSLIKRDVDPSLVEQGPATQCRRL